MGAKRDSNLFDVRVLFRSNKDLKRIHRAGQWKQAEWKRKTPFNKLFAVQTKLTNPRLRKNLLMSDFVMLNYYRSKVYVAVRVQFYMNQKGNKNESLTKIAHWKQKMGFDKHFVTLIIINKFVASTKWLCNRMCDFLPFRLLQKFPLSCCVIIETVFVGEGFSCPHQFLFKTDCFHPSTNT